MHRSNGISFHPHLNVTTGAVVKHYWAKKMNVDPTDVILVSIMPCTAKKHEAARPEMGGTTEDGRKFK